jgi:hypothetical protein
MDGVLAGLGVRCAALIGADNPLGRRVPDGVNRRMRRALLEAARRYRFVEAEGRLGAWREHHLLVGAGEGAALVLARRFRQAGIVLLSRGRAPRLRGLGPFDAG